MGLSSIEFDGLHAIESGARGNLGGDNFDPVNVFVETLDDLGAGLAGLADSGGVQNGGTLTVNAEALGSYDYRVVDGNTTISAFSSTDWFSVTADRAAVIVVKGNLTINSGQIVIPTARKQFVFLYVTGTLTVVGSLSMSARGGNHSATGSNVTARAMRIVNGTHSGVSNPQVPAAGASGGAARTGTSGPGNPGSAGSAGGTGGGGGGGRGGGTSGAGAAGTSFSGGTGGGGSSTVGTSGSGASSGGAGGDGGAGVGGGGAGNPGGIEGAFGLPAMPGKPGTGGVLVIICDELAGSGTIVATGANGGNGSSGGGGSGGGSVTVLYGTDTSSVTPTAAGGTGGTGTRAGGNGGAGTARKLARAA